MVWHDGTQDIEVSLTFRLCGLDWSGFARVGLALLTVGFGFILLIRERSGCLWLLLAFGLLSA